MAKWLDKYEQGGMVLKKKTKDNYGKKPNVNDAKVSAGPGFEGDGYTAQNWRSPAWGGQFEMGGSLPGSVGFMYARTINPAPANGKYTKKTLASAQFGMLMPYVAQAAVAVKNAIPTIEEVKTKATDVIKKSPTARKLANKVVSAVANSDWGKKKLQNFARNIDPRGYGLDSEIKSPFDRAYSAAILNKKEKAREEFDRDLAIPGKAQPSDSVRVDLINKYAGLPEKFGTLKPSAYIPSVGNKNEKYFSSPQIERTLLSEINQVVESNKLKGNFKTKADLENFVANHFSSRQQDPRYPDDPSKSIPVKGKGNNYVTMIEGLGSATVGIGEDERGPYLSYYDNWDLNPYYGSYAEGDNSFESPSDKLGRALVGNEKEDVATKHIGNPTKMYGRIYFDKKTGKPKMQNGGEMEYYQNGLDFKPKSISKKGKKIIKDDMGQWAHPGEITEIGSPDITMQGVDYPVLGISDTGDTQMMYPDQDYKFNGKKVTEYPMAQTGISMGVESGTYQPTSKVVTQKDIKAAKIQEMRDKQGSITKAGPRQSALSKSWSILTNPMTALEYKVRHRDLPDHFERGPRNVLDYAVDIINPYGIADAAANIPGDISRGDIGSAALNTLAILPALHELGAVGKATKTASQLGKAKNLKEAVGYVAKGIPVEKSLPRLAEGEVKTFRKLQEIPKMQEAGKSRADQMRFAIENDIPDTHFERIFQMPKKDAQNLINSGFGERPAVDREALRNRFRQLDEQQAVTVPQNPSRSVREGWISDIDNLTAQGAEPNHDFYEQLGHRTTPTSYEQMTDSEIESLRNHLFDRQMSARRERIANENRMLGVDNDIDRDFIDMTEPEDEWIFYHEGREVGRSSDPNARVEDFLPRQKTSNIGDKLTRAEISARDKINTFIQNATQSYPYYSGSIEEKVPSLFRSQEKSLTDVSRKVAKQTENIPSGTVYTGSLNTSHNSWLPQTKQIFNYEGGTPLFTGYKPMNSLGYLSKAQVPEEDIIKYLNTEMDELVKRGKLPKNVQRPMMFKGHPMLPQYAIKQKKSGGWLNKYK